MPDMFYNGFFFVLGALTAVLVAYVILTLLQVVAAFVTTFIETLIQLNKKD